MEHKDFGEKIGGARKDLRGRFLISDIETLTHIERCKYVRKDMVWPTPDFADLVSEGKMTRQGALMVKMLRDQFPAAPVVNENISEEAYLRACESYVKVLNAARGVTKCKDEREVSDFLSRDVDFHAMVGRPVSSTGTAVFTQSDELSKWKTGGMNFPYTGFRDIARAVSCAHSMQLTYEAERASRKNPEWPFGTSRAEVSIRKERFDFIQTPDGSGFTLARYSLPLSQNTAAYYNQRFGIAELIGKKFETRAEGMKALVTTVENFNSSKRKATSDKRLEVAENRHGDIEERVGPSFREGEVSGQNYLDHFGLKGGEFGLWVNQDERQQVLNKGFDSFKDLADILGFHPGQISMGGDLSIAFGSRGTGNAGGMVAAATYSPGRQVINLTKPHGEGCLAHEYGHYLDHKAGRIAKEIGLPVRAEAGIVFLSECQLAENHLSSVSPQNLEIAKKLVSLNRAMREIISSDKVTPVSEMIESSKAKLAKQTERYITTHIPDLLTQLRHLLKGAEMSAGEIDDVVRNAELIINSFTKIPEDKDLRHEVKQALEKLRLSIGKRVRFAHYVSRVEEATHNMNVYRSQIKYLRSPDAKPIKGHAYTNYHGACKKLDEMFHKSKPYYVLAREMFARCFEAGIRDALSERGRSSPFLVSGTNTQAYPIGEERQKFNRQILPLVAELCRSYDIANPNPTPVQPRNSLAFEAEISPASVGEQPPPPPCIQRTLAEHETNPELIALESRLSVHRSKPIQIDLF